MNDKLTRIWGVTVLAYLTRTQTEHLPHTIAEHRHYINLIGDTPK
jgi:hypothetical protein